MSAQLDNMIRDANNEIGLLRNKIAFLETEQLALKRKSLQLNDTLQEKTRQYAKLQVLLGDLLFLFSKRLTVRRMFTTS